MFEVIFNYGEGHSLHLPSDPALAADARTVLSRRWPRRPGNGRFVLKQQQIRNDARCKKSMVF